MSLLRRSFVALTLLLTIAPATAVAPVRDWATVATRKADGAFVQGNPAAPVKLVEYLSLTCPHCAHFEAEGIGPLTSKYIRTGQVSYEVRHALRDAFDWTASLLARCNGPEAFFAITPAVYARQNEWFARAAKWSETAPDAKDMTPDRMLPLVADGAGLSEFFAAQGVPDTKGKACVANTAEQQVLASMANEAWRRPNFPGTPAFFINGAAADVASWADLDRRLSAALAPTRARPAQKRRR